MWDVDSSESAPGEQITRETEDVWPALVKVYQEQGYDSGFARGASEALATALEAIEEFLQQNGAGNAENRRLLYRFADFLEQRVRSSSGDACHGAFIDGLGI